MRRSFLLLLVLALAVGGDVTLPRRMLIASGGGPYSLHHPPFDAAWTRQGAVLEPAVAWESTSIQEPDVRFEAGVFKMWAKSGWATTGLGYYVSSDGLTWMPYPANPVLGAGGSGVAAELAQPMIVWDGAQYRCYFNSGGDADPNTPRYATSSDGTAWTVGGSGTFITNPGAITQWGNRHFWQEGANWYGLQEARSGGRWRIYYVTSSDGYSWTIGNGSAALTTLELSGSHNTGGPTMLDSPKIGSTYHLWFHSGTGSNSDLYHSTSTDRITWTTPTLVLAHSGSGDEVDQVADPSLLVVGSTAYLFYAGVNNSAETGVILLLTAPALP